MSFNTAMDPPLIRFAELLVKEQLEIVLSFPSISIAPAYPVVALLESNEQWDAVQLLPWKDIAALLPAVLLVKLVPYILP